MVTSMVKQEAIEHFICKVNAMCKAFSVAEVQSQCAKWPQSSPSDHYHIAAMTRFSHDLTEWLEQKGKDPATEVVFVLVSLFFFVFWHILGPQ